MWLTVFPIVFMLVLCASILMRSLYEENRDM